MKRILIFLFAGSAFLSSCKDDSDDVAPDSVPEAVRTSLLAQFPNAVNVEWEKAGANYEVDFDIDMIDYDALMAADGTILKYKHDIQAAELPETIANALSTSYPDARIEDPEKLYEGQQLYYQVELEGGNAQKLVYSEDGQQVTTPTYWD